MRITARSLIESLYDYERFEDRFKRRLDIQNARGYIQFGVGEDLSFVHSEWLKHMHTRSVLAYENVLLIITQDILGELAHLLARHDTVQRAGWPVSRYLDPELVSFMEFVYHHRCAYFAMDFCTSLYRQMMHYEQKSYVDISEPRFRGYVQDVSAHPTRARVFMRRLEYPGRDETKLTRDDD